MKQKAAGGSSICFRRACIWVEGRHERGVVGRVPEKPRLDGHIEKTIKSSWTEFVGFSRTSEGTTIDLCIIYKTDKAQMHGGEVLHAEWTVVFIRKHQ